MDEEKIQYDFDKKANNKENSSFYSHKLKTNIDKNNNSYYINNILGNHYNESKYK